MNGDKLPFSMDPGAPPPPPEHGALVSCLRDAHGDHFRPGYISERLKYLLQGPGLAGGDPYEWYLCRWKERDTADIGEDYPEVRLNDFVAWCDPEEFGEEHHWRVYPEDEFKQLIEHTFSVWAEQEPKNRKEYAEALAEHGMHLVTINLDESAYPPNARQLGRRRKPGFWQRLFGRGGR